MAEKVEIVVSAKDQASAVLRGMAGNLRGEIKQIEGANASLARSAQGMATQSAGSWQKMTGYVKTHEDQLRTAGVAMIAFGAAVTGLAISSVRELAAQETAQAKLSAAIKGTRQQLDQTSFEKLASSLQKTTTYADEDILTVTALLATFDMTQDQIEQLTPRILNIAAIMDVDLQSAAVAVGKAIQLGLGGALRRFGIIIDDATMKSGDFSAILAAIDRNTGPAAEERLKTVGGQLKQMGNYVGEVKESIGKGLTPAIYAANKVLIPLAETMGKIAETDLGKAFIIAGTAVGVLLVPLGGLLMTLPSLAKGWDILSGAEARNAAAALAAAEANAAALATIAAGNAVLPAVAARTTVATGLNVAAQNAPGVYAVPTSRAAKGVGTVEKIVIGGGGIATGELAARPGLLGRAGAGLGRAGRFLGRGARAAGGVAMGPIGGVGTIAAATYFSNIYGEAVFQERLAKAEEQMGQPYPNRTPEIAAAGKAQYERFMTKWKVARVGAGMMSPSALTPEEMAEAKLSPDARVRIAEWEAANWKALPQIETESQRKRREAAFPQSRTEEEIGAAVGMQRTGPRSFFLPYEEGTGRLGRAPGLMPRITNTAPGVNVSAPSPDRITIEVELPVLTPGEFDDQTTYFLEDMSYAMGDDF